VSKHSRVAEIEAYFLRRRVQNEVAIKIPKADVEPNELKALLHMKDYPLSHEGRDHVLGLLDHFDHVGPNGIHQCLVFDVMDGSLNHRESYLPQIVQEISRQMAKGLDFIHKCGLVHSGTLSCVYTLPYSKRELHNRSVSGQYLVSHEASRTVQAK
jgi:serine/threonine protein kinase